MASSTSDGPLEELLAPVVAQSGLELDSVTRSRSDAMPLLRVIVEAPIGADGIDSDTLAEVAGAGMEQLAAAGCEHPRPAIHRDDLAVLGDAFSAMGAH